MPLRVDFHCHVIFTCVYKHVTFNLVNKIEARYKLLSIFCFNVERGSNFTFTCDLSNIASILFANVNFTHIRDNGNPPLISFNKESLLKRCCYYSTPPIARTYRTRIGFLYRVIFTYVHIRKQIVTLVERGSTFSFTRDLPYNASISYARIKVTRPSFFLGGGYHPTLNLSGIPTFTFIVSLTHRIDKI